MCPGTEFGIMDGIMGVIMGIFAFFMTVAFGFHWYTVGWWIVTAGWIGMSIYCFYFASKCQCKQIEANIKATLDKLDSLTQNKK